MTQQNAKNYKRFYKMEQKQSKLGIILNSVASVFDGTLDNKDFLPLDCQIFQTFLKKYSYDVVYHDFLKDSEGLKGVFRNIRDRIQQYEVLVFYINGRAIWNQQKQQTLISCPNGDLLCIENEIMNLKNNLKPRVIPMVCIVNCDRTQTLRFQEQTSPIDMTGLIFAYMTRPTHAKIRLPEFYSVGSGLSLLIKEIEMNPQDLITVDTLIQIMRKIFHQIQFIENNPKEINDLVFFKRKQNLQTIKFNYFDKPTYYGQSNGRILTWMHGFGQNSYAGLESDYKGYFSWNQRQGYGTYKSPSFVYEGEWDMQSRTGRGVLELYQEVTVKSDDGQQIKQLNSSCPVVQVGWFRNDRFAEGPISAQWYTAYDQFYIGQIQNNLYHFRGSYYWTKNQQAYHGDWEKGVMQGEGILITKSSYEFKEQRGTFEKGVLTIKADMYNHEQQATRQFEFPC
ncbi:hypothetical protein FGO68_gene13153 [Halteria grandinella]|uniref:Uncharacterized protein n=1 Tax=Halteria grandinella TaxID=5974 RepID=A0A8J8NNB5_HALGN|nr:hypothetical protein FGO68_gene13153 [Halteria grandinella]